MEGEVVPIPARKPNCDKEREALLKAAEEYQKLEDRQNQLLSELAKLVEENNRFNQKTQQTLGLVIAAHFLSIPIHALGLTTEILREFFGEKISNFLLNSADKLAKERVSIAKKVDFKEAQFRIVAAQLKNARMKLEQAEKALENCEENIQ